MQASHGLEGPPEHQTDVTTDQAHGKTIGSFVGDYRAKTVASGQAHWSADHSGRPVCGASHLPSPLEGSFVEDYRAKAVASGQAH